MSQVRTVSVPEKWPILAEVPKTEEQLANASGATPPPSRDLHTEVTPAAEVAFVEVVQQASAPEEKREKEVAIEAPSKERTLPENVVVKGEAAPVEPAKVEEEEWKEVSFRFRCQKHFLQFYFFLKVKPRRRERQSSLSLSFSESSQIVAPVASQERQVEERRPRERQSSLCVVKTNGGVAVEDREELDFQFDEELDNPLPAVKHNTFTNEWSDSESEYDEVGDDFINKVCLILEWIPRLCCADVADVVLMSIFLDPDRHAE